MIQEIGRDSERLLNQVRLLCAADDRGVGQGKIAEPQGFVDRIDHRRRGMVAVRDAQLVDPSPEEGVRSLLQTPADRSVWED